MKQSLQVSVEQGMEFAKLCAELDGFVQGAQAMSEFVKRLAVQSLANPVQSMQKEKTEDGSAATNATAAAAEPAEPATATA